MNQYYALIGDIIESRQLANRAQQQEALSQVLDNLNDRYQAHLASRFSLTLGDEFQGLVKVGAPIFQIIDQLRLALPDLNLRFGLGLGEILTSINQPLVWGLMGRHIGGRVRPSNKSINSITTRQSMSIW